MIIRILGEGQYSVDDVDRLNELDTRLQDVVDSGDEVAFASSLRDLLDAVRELGKPVPDDALVASELVLPSADASLEEVRALLGDEGLIPG